MPQKRHIKLNTQEKILLLLTKPFTGASDLKLRILSSTLFADITPHHEGLLCKECSQKAGLTDKVFTAEMQHLFLKSLHFWDIIAQLLLFITYLI